MLSRVAGNIYWMARYLERTEDLARLVNVNANLALDLPRGVSPIWGQLIAITGADESYQGDYEERSVLRFLITNSSSPTSILSSLSYARENARTIRDVIPREVWETINTTYHYARENTSMALSKRGRYPFLQEIISQCQVITGILAGTMNHDVGYTFLKIGRNLERADMTSRIIDTRSANLLPEEVSQTTTFDNLQWMSVLKSLTGYQMYRREMQVRIRRQDVLQFLIYSKEFPRAIAHCVNTVENSVGGVPNSGPILESIADLREHLTNVDVEKLKAGRLQAFIDEIQVGFASIHDALYRTYFGGDTEEAESA